MKKALRTACLVLALILMAGLCGCSSKKAAMPTLKIVYLAGNVTSTYDVAGRENAITTRGIFGDNTKTYSWDEPLEPTVIDASNSGGTIQLAFSYAADDLSVYVSDPETGETQTVTGTTIEVESGKSYSISAAGSWASGTYIYQMEFAFDLIFSPEEQEAQPEKPVIAEKPEAEPEVSAKPEVSVEPEPEVSGVPSEKPAPAEGDKIFDNPPALIVSYNSQTMKPAMGTTTWDCEVNGIMNSYSADSDHPMQWKNIRTVERVYGKDFIELNFEVEPDEYSITLWNDKYMDFEVENYEAFFDLLEETGEPIVLEDGAFELNTGYETGYVVMVEAKWNHGQQDDTGYWGGDTVYAFRVSPTNY